VTSAGRILCTAFLLGVCLGGVSASAYATSTGQSPCTGTQCESHGDRYRNLGGSDNGTRAYIAGSGSATGTGQAIYAYVAVQDAVGPSEDSPPGTGTAGMVIMGELSRDIQTSDACGFGGPPEAFFFYRVHGQQIGQCPYHPAISPFGSGGLFDVVYQNGAWQAKQNGNTVATASGLGFTSGWSVAGDEAFAGQGPSCTGTGPSEAITFGPSGRNAWQFTTNNGSTYSTIQTSAVDQNTDSDCDGDGDWNLGGTPSPFNINWTGF